MEVLQSENIEDILFDETINTDPLSSISQQQNETVTELNMSNSRKRQREVKQTTEETLSDKKNQDEDVKEFQRDPFNMITNCELDISDLKDVIEALKQGYFPNHKFIPLGLQLGLLQPTLADIKANHKDDVESGLRECLTRWLRKADKVTENGGSTRKSLADALHKIEENFAAKKIMEFEFSTPAYQMFQKVNENFIAEEHKRPLVEMQKEVLCRLLQKHSESLLQVVFPMETVWKLHKEGVISKETLDELERSEGLLTDDSLRALSNTVSEDPNQLKVFSTVLLQSEDTRHFAQDILKEYNQNFLEVPSLLSQSVTDTTVQTSQQVTSTTTQSSVMTHHLSPTYKYDFDQMRTKLGDLILTVLPLIESAVTSKLKELKTFLRMSFQELKPQLAIAESFDDVMDIVREKCTIINIACLEAIINRYKIEEAKSHITAYKMEVDQFCEDVKLRVCENEDFMPNQSSLLKCETMKFLLEWDIDKHTLSEVQDLLWKAFGSMAKRVLVKKAEESNSIIVTCYAPYNITDILLMEAEKNLDILIKMGLMKLSISYHIVYDRCTRDKEVRCLMDEVKGLEEKLVLQRKSSAENDQPILKLKSSLEGTQDQSLTDTLSEKLKLSEKMSKAKTLEIEKLNIYKETTDKVLLEKQEEIEKLTREKKATDKVLLEKQEEIEKLTREKEATDKVLVEKQEEIEKLTREKEATHKVLLEKQEEIEKLTREKEATHKVLVEKQEEIEKLTREKEATHKVLVEKQEEIEKLTREKEATDKVLVEKQEEIKKLTREKEDSKMELELQTKLGGAKTLETEQSSVQQGKEVRDLEKKVNDLEDRLKKVTAEKDQKTKELQDSNVGLGMLKKVSRAKTPETEQYQVTSVLQGKELDRQDEINQLTREKEAANKLLVDTQENLEILQDKVSRLSWQLNEKENKQLLENINGLKSCMREVSARFRSENPEFSQRLDEIATDEKEEVGISATPGYTGDIEWCDDRIVELNLPNKVQCEEVVTKLKEEKQLGQEWSIRLKKSSSKVASAIISNLNECAVTTLDIRYTPLTSSFMSTLSDILSENKTLKRLVFFDSPFPGGDMKQLTRAISTNTTLEELVMENVPVTDEDATYLSDMLKNNETLKLLRLIACNITDNGIHNIHEGLVKNKAMTRLFFSNNPQITSVSTNVIVDLMRNTKLLKELHLAATLLKDKDIETICNALVKVDTMEILMLSKRHQEHCQTLDCYDDIKSKLHFW